MLVQLSPWQTCSTSVPVSARRRRKRSDASLMPPEAERLLEVEASFVTSAQRNRKKKKLSEPSLQHEPIVAVTASHRISIVGRGASQELDECSQWQFRSHPGRTTSFVQESGSKMARIPAIMDARNDCMFALQNENKTLAFWNVNASSGPDDVDAPAIKVKLVKPAVSLSTLVFQKGVAFGTCEGGSLFVTKRNEHGSLEVEYYSEPVHEQSKDAHHVFTSVQAASGHTKARAGQKRKASHEQGDFVFYQVFSKANRVFTYKRQVNLKNKDCLNDGANVQVSIVDLRSEDMNGSIVDPVSLSCSQVDDWTIAIVFAVEGGENEGKAEERHFYCAPIDLETGQLRRPPFPLANFARDAGAVTPSLLAVARLDEILLYDLLHGAVVSRSSVTDVVGDCKNWSLITETRKGRIAVLSVQNGYAHVAFARAIMDDISYQQATSQGNGYNLAIGLRSSLAFSLTPLDNVSTPSFQKSLLDLACTDAEGEKSKRRLDDCVSEALVRLQRCIDEIQDPDNTDIQPFYFMNEYERTTVSIQDASMTPLPSPRAKKSNAPKLQKKLAPLSNGVHHAEASDSTLDTEATSSTSKTDEVNGSAHNTVNGLKVPTKVVRGYTPSDLPQQFVDGATSIVLSVLQLPKVTNKAVGIRTKLARLDARLILSRLIRTGKVSARRHFDQCLHPNDYDTIDYFFSVLRSLKLTKKGGNRVFSPVDLMHEMITWCPDISERQMITMIHFMLCKALPEDIAENFLDEGNLQAGHPYRVLAKRLVQVRSALRKQQATAKVETEEVSKLREQEQSLALKLVRTGTGILVGRLVRYSRCNETLLRNAMAEGLPGRHEPTILARVLVNLLDDHGKNELLPSAPPDFAPLMTKWISTLCEACQDRLVGELDGESPLSLILASIRAALKSSEAIMSLQLAVYKFGTSKSDDNKEEGDDTTTDLKKLAASASASHTREATPVPFYSIERLAF